MNDRFSISNIFIHKYVPDASDWTSPTPRQVHYLAYQKEGRVMHYLSDGRMMDAAPDTVIFLNAKDDYAAHMIEFGCSYAAQLSIDNPPESFIIDCQDNRMKNLFNIIYNCRNLKLDSNYYRAIGAVYEVFGMISRRRESEYMESSTVGKLYAVKLYIDEHFSDPTLTLDDLAKLSGLTPHHMSVLFKKKFGVPCWQYMIDTRIEAAVRLTQSPGYTVRMIAEQCGFSDVYYFSRLFKRRTGISPGAACRGLPEIQPDN